jgi:hypothetical protein
MLLLVVVGLLFSSSIVPTYHSNLGNISHEYEVELANYLKEKASVNGLFYFDLHLLQIFRFVLASSYGSIYPIYLNNITMIHDRYAYAHEYLVSILLSRNILISITERSTERWFYLYNETIFSILNLDEFNIIYDSQYSRTLI